MTSNRPSLDTLLSGMPDPKTGATESLSSTTSAASAGDPTLKDPAQPADAVADSPAETLTGDKPPAEPADPEITRRTAAISKQEQRFRDEQKRARADLEMERAEIARMRAETKAGGASFDELKALAKKDPMAALERLGLAGEDDLEVVARAAYANSKSGKTDPRNKQYAEQTAREREYSSKIEALESRYDDLRQQLSQRDQQTQAEQYVSKYLDAAVKELPKEPSLIGTLHTKNPEKARTALLQTAQRMEREAMEADGLKSPRPEHTPSHAEVIAEYERSRRAELEEQGVDVGAMLRRAPTAQTTQSVPPPAKPAATLDPTTGGATRPVDRTKMSETERRAAILKEMPWDKDR